MNSDSIVGQPFGRHTASGKPPEAIADGCSVHKAVGPGVGFWGHFVFLPFTLGSRGREKPSFFLRDSKIYFNSG